jgi:hypothetical protein
MFPAGSGDFSASFRLVPVKFQLFPVAGIIVLGGQKPPGDSNTVAQLADTIEKQEEQKPTSSTEDTIEK